MVWAAFRSHYWFGELSYIEGKARHCAELDWTGIGIVRTSSRMWSNLVTCKNRFLEIRKFLVPISMCAQRHGFFPSRMFAVSDQYSNVLFAGTAIDAGLVVDDDNTASIPSFAQVGVSWSYFTLSLSRRLWHAVLASVIYCYSIDDFGSIRSCCWDRCTA